jgi:hypothetical protein
MASPLKYIGVDPETGDADSSTVWFDEAAREFVFQGLKADDDLRKRITETPAPGHVPGIPDHEDVIRMPARMVAVLRKACDAAEAAERLD